jgi:hypothetical protein
MVFFYLWVGQAMNSTLALKFGGLAQRWGSTGLGKGGAGWNPEPLLGGRATPPPSPPGQGGCCLGGNPRAPCPPPTRGTKWAGPRQARPHAPQVEGAGVLGRGGMGWIHAPPPLLTALLNILWNFTILSYFLEILVFFSEIFLYLKLK